MVHNNNDVLKRRAGYSRLDEYHDTLRHYWTLVVDIVTSMYIFTLPNLSRKAIKQERVEPAHNNDNESL